MEIDLLCEGRRFVFSGEEADPYFKIWREIGRYGGVRDIIPYRMALRPGDVFIDVGGNIGLTAVLSAALAPGSTGYFFEPDPTNFHHLQTVISRNELARFQAFNMAVGDRPGSLHFIPMGASGHAAHEGETGIDIEIIALDDFAKNMSRLDFLKIDVEGFEREVLLGSRATIERLKPVALIEFNSITTIMEARMLPQDLLEMAFSFFPYVDYVDIHSGKPQRIANTPYAKRDFVAMNLMSGFIHDLLCYFEPGRINHDVSVEL
jgi:FkbM family methyltransferase